MDVKIANAVGGYLETLYDVNVKLIKLCGIDIMSSYENNERLVLDIVQDIFRLFPYKYDRKKKLLALDYSGGLLEFKDAFEFLKNDFLDILKTNDELLNSIRQIRNKYEHKMHAVRIIGQGSGSLSLFDFDFVIDEIHFSLYAGSLIALLTQLNSVYLKIQREVAFFARDNGKTDYAYYRRLTRFDFDDFSKIYQDNNLRLIGKLMHTF